MSEDAMFDGRDRCRALAPLKIAPFAVVLTASMALGQASGVSRIPTPPPEVPLRVVGAHVLVSHVEAKRRVLSVTRTRAEARMRAEEALALARDPEVRFIDVVQRYSDEPFALERGGRLGGLQPVARAQFRGAFEVLGEALFGMEVGQVSDIVETPAGFHILRRLPIRRYAASHILLQYAGSERAKAGVTRTEEEARRLAEEMLAKARQSGADFAALARAHSDGPSAAQGGFLGHFETGQIALELETALDTMRVGEVSGPVETRLGFHILYRQEFEADRFHRITVSQILIRYDKAKALARDGSRAAKAVARTREEARARAEKIAAEARAEAADFAALARTYSDGPEAEAGGILGSIGRGDIPLAEFEKAAFALGVGEVAGPIETAFGFHIVLRHE